MSLDEESREGYIVSSQMKKVWKIQLELLKKLLDVCQKHDLKIWADGGTLLGAVRHKGYIPWDDDIDMMMIREDYDKLVAIAPSEFTGNLFFQCAETDKKYIRGHAQLRRSDTAAILPVDIWQSFNQGIFIDIFVCDYIPKTEEERVRCFNKLERQRRKLIDYFYRTLLCMHPMPHLKSIIHVYSNGGYRNCFEKMKNTLIGFPDKSTTELSPIMWSAKNYQKYTFELDWIKDTVLLPFEDLLLPVPKNYDAILTREYGDYMIPVQAPSCHGTVIFDVERSYVDVLQELRKKTSLKNKISHLFT